MPSTILACRYVFPKWLRFAVSLRPRSSYLSATSPHRKYLGFWYIALEKGDQQPEQLLKVKSVHRHSHQELRHIEHDLRPPRARHTPPPSGTPSAAPRYVKRPEFVSWVVGPAPYGVIPPFATIHHRLAASHLTICPNRARLSLVFYPGNGRRRGRHHTRKRERRKVLCVWLWRGDRGWK